MEQTFKLVFFGTPEFAAGCLRQLLDDGHHVAVVVTAPDRPKGRGLEMQPSAVKILATEKNLPVLQPSNLKDEAFIRELKSYHPDLGVVVAFRMLPLQVWNMPPKGTVNLHASLLPDYRGAAPINWAIINGETKTGITTFFLKHEIDTGDLIDQEEVAIPPDMNAGMLHDELLRRGARLLSESVKRIAEGKVESHAQEEMISDHCALHKAPKLHKQDGKIDWKKTRSEIHNLIRGLSPYPAAWSTFVNDAGKEINFKIFAAQPAENASAVSGKIRIENKEHIYIGTGDGWLEILSLQLEGKRRVESRDFLNGFQPDGFAIKSES